MSKTEAKRRASAERAFANAMATAIEMGLIQSVDQFHAKGELAQTNILASVSRLNTRRFGQGWSR